MTRNNNERMNIFLNLINPYDYKEFSQSCEKAGIEPLSWLEYVQKAQGVMNAMNKYPDLIPVEAYLTYLKDTGGVLIPTGEEKKGCGSCGGGKVK